VLSHTSNVIARRVIKRRRKQPSEVASLGILGVRSADACSRPGRGLVWGRFTRVGPARSSALVSPRTGTQWRRPWRARASSARSKWSLSRQFIRTFARRSGSLPHCRLGEERRARTSGPAGPCRRRRSQDPDRSPVQNAGRLLAKYDCCEVPRASRGKVGASRRLTELGVIAEPGDAQARGLSRRTRTLLSY
jgi:hypothetical protein